MSVNKVNKANGTITLLAGSTLWADSPIGTILAYGGTNVPTGWMLCQGQAISRTTYAELFAVIGTTFGSGNGSTTFNLPDLRNKAVMGAGTNGALGASQSAQLPNITGIIDNKSGTFGIMGFSSGTGSFSGALIGSEAKGAVYTGQQNTSSCKVVTFDASHSGASTDINGNNVYTNNGETRPANVRLNFIIKAKHVAVPVDFMSAVDEAVEEALGSDWNTITDVSASTYFASVNLKYKKIGNILFVHGKATFNAVTIPSDSYDVLIATLPSGYRPKSAIRSITNIENGFSIISPQLQIEFSTNGKLLVYTSENIALGTSGKPISFQFVVES